MNSLKQKIREKANTELVIHEPTNAWVVLPEAYVKLKEILTVLGDGGKETKP